MAELKITAANFENEVLHSDKPVLLDFYADWCGPCKMIAPVLHEIAEENAGALKVGKVNVDEQMELAMRFQVSCRSQMISEDEWKPAAGANAPAAGFLYDRRQSRAVVILRSQNIFSKQAVQNAIFCRIK